MSVPVQDLIAVVADSHQEACLSALLGHRCRSLGIRAISYTVYVHSGKDPGCRKGGPEFLRTFAKQFRSALLIFDHDGSGAESIKAVELEDQLQSRLDGMGWQSRSAVIVIEPETEAWVWSPSNEVDAALGWSGRIPSLRQWLVEEGLLGDVTSKPPDPKTAMQRALRFVGKNQSASNFRRLAETISFQNCRDRSFQKLWNQLKLWFPQDQS